MKRERVISVDENETTRVMLNVRLVATVHQSLNLDSSSLTAATHIYGGGEKKVILLKVTTPLSCFFFFYSPPATASSVASTKQLPHDGTDEPY
jgi:hypothetical protein